MSYKYKHGKKTSPKPLILLLFLIFVWNLNILISYKDAKLPSWTSQREKEGSHYIHSI